MDIPENDFSSFVLDFFRKLGSSIHEEDGVYVITSIPRSFTDIAGLREPYRLCFTEDKDNSLFVFPGSSLAQSISTFLDNSGKTTLLSIEFDIDPAAEIKKHISLKNCEIDGITKRESSNHFARFSFMTRFRYLNDVSQVLHEVYVHDGKVVTGDLAGYKVSHGESKALDSGFLKDDFSVAKGHLQTLVASQRSELEEKAHRDLDFEIERIKEYYGKQLSEYADEISDKLDRIKEFELELRATDVEEEKEALRSKIERLQKSLLKLTDDEAKERILQEQDFTVRDTREKHSLNIATKLLNTTVISYPVYSFQVYLKNDTSKRYIDLMYDPLIQSIPNLSCDVCSTTIREVLLCNNGHVVCGNCLSVCGECGESYCTSCISRDCSVCGKKLCKHCLVVCRGCSKTACATHMRTDSVSGDNRCMNCLRACSKCHGLSQEEFFGESSDGSKVCMKCLGAEKRDGALESVFS